jgi:hypothetical protein
MSAAARCLCCDELTNVLEDELGAWEAALCQSCARVLPADETNVAVSLPLAKGKTTPKEAT